MPDAPDPDQLKSLDDKIGALRKAHEPEAREDTEFSKADMAWRMVIELVAGLGIGFCIGFGLDWLFNTRPFLMVLFIFLGFIAGVKTMLKTAQELQAKQAAEAAKDERD